MTPFEDKVGEAHVEIVARLDQLEKDLNKAKEETDASAKKMSKSFGGLKKSIGLAAKALGPFVAGLGLIAGARGLERAIEKTLDTVDALDKTSSKLGVTTGWLQKAQYAASQSGIAWNTLAMSMQRFTRRAAEANEGLGEAQDAIKTLGIELRDANGNLRNTEDLFTDAMEALASVKDPGERLRLAFKLFDSEGAVLVNLADNFKNLAKEAEAMGLVVDDSVIKAGVEAKDKLDTLSRIVKAELTQALVQLAPTLVSVANQLVRVAHWAGLAWDRFSDFLNLDPITISQMNDELGELSVQLETAYANAAKAMEDLAESGGKLNLARVAQLQEIIHRLEKRRDEIAADRDALLEATAPREVVEPELGGYQKVSDEWEELNDQRQAALTLFEKEADSLQDMWSNTADTAARSMSQMVADGEVSFAALGKAFVREFTQRVMESLVFSRIFGFLEKAMGMIGFGGGGGGLEVGGSAGAWGQGGQLYQPDYSGRLDWVTSGRGAMSNVANPGSVIQVFNSTGAPTETQKLMDGTTRIFVGQQGARDIMMGGELDKAIQHKYGLTPKGVRK